MLKNMDPPLGFGSKCPDRLAFKKLIRMNQPIDDEGMVHFTTTLFALIRENLSIKMRAAEEMDQADFELRQTIIKVWPYEGKEKIDLLVPPREGKQTSHTQLLLLLLLLLLRFAASQCLTIIKKVSCCSKKYSKYKQTADIGSINVNKQLKLLIV